MKIALLSNINIDLLASRLKEYLAGYGIESDFYISGFNQYVQEMVNPDSILRKEIFDFAILFLDGEELFHQVISEPFRFRKDDIEQIIDREIGNLRLQLENVLQSSSRLTFFLNNIFIRKPTIIGALDYNTDLNLSGLQDEFNAKIGRLKISERIVIVDFAALPSRYGYEALYDNRLWYIGRIKFSGQGLHLLSEMYSLYIQAYLGKRKKVLILDLDNTLWGGIIGEDGLEGIKLGEDGIGRAYLDFQRLIKSLKHKGILLTICSKNNLADVTEVFEKHNFMELRENDFVALKINWENKVENIKELAAILNLGLDSFVFVDDNPFERQLVKTELPQVIVPDFPDDPVNLYQWFIDLSFRYFNNIMVTAEDKLRTEIYQSDTRRKELKKSTTTLEDFYRSLEMKAIIKIDSQSDFKRIAQLTQRTNQFNLTTRRYTENQITDFMNSSDWMVLSLELNDRFGSNGIVGVLIVKLDGADSYIDTFLLSCRVIGRTVEDVFLFYLTEILREKGIRKVIGEYIPTKKNSLVKDIYQKFGFNPLKNEKDNSDLWMLDLTKEALKGNQWIKIETA
jgi:FkbH-like protein